MTKSWTRLFGPQTNQIIRVVVPQLLVAVLLGIYVCVGSVVFMFLDEAIANKTFPEVVLFSFTTLATIGYGDIHPTTYSAQLFCIVFSIVGIPMTLLTLANLGKYLTKVYWMILFCFGKNIKWRACQNAKMPLLTVITLLLVTFAFGSFFFYEKGRGFTVDDMYFSVISFATVGFGDRTPTADDPVMLFGMVAYLIWGMILMTTFFTGVSGHLRTVHYLGKRLRGSRDVQIWFGGKSMKVAELLEIVSQEFNVSPRELKNLLRNLDNLITTAVEETQVMSAKPSLLHLAAQYKKRKGISLQDGFHDRRAKYRLHRYSGWDRESFLKPRKVQSSVQKTLGSGQAPRVSSNSIDFGELTRLRMTEFEL